MEAPTHIKCDGKMYEVLKGVFNFCLQDEVQKQIIRNANEHLFFKGIDRGELGIVDLLIEVFKIRSKIWCYKKTQRP